MLKYQNPSIKQRYGKYQGKNAERKLKEEYILQFFLVFLSIFEKIKGIFETKENKLFRSKK